MAYELSTGKHTIPLNEYCASFEIRHQMGPGDGLRVARILMWEHTLKCDLNNPNLQSAPINSLICTFDASVPRTAAL